MNSEERAREIVAAIMDICQLDLGDKQSQVEACVKSHLDEIERGAAEKTVAIYREKGVEASDKVFATTTAGAPPR
jgi:hypothetical protein